MKKQEYTELICKRFCNYYKPNKEIESCRGYSYLRDLLTPFEVESLIVTFDLTKHNCSTQDLSFLCEKCDFREDGCDFIFDKSKVPCGGYLLIGKLIDYLNSQI